MPRYVVAGVTGRVGRAVAEELLARGVRPAVIVRDEARGAAWRDRGAEVVVGGLEHRTFLTRALEGADGFFTLLPENVDPGDFHGARRRMADAITAAVRDSGVPHVVLHSAIAAVLPAGNGPAAALHDLERQLRASGTRLSALRAAYLQDNVRDVIPAARHAGVFPTLLPPDVPFPMIAAVDAGRLAAQALMRPPAASEVVDLIGPPCSMREVAGRLSVALGRALEVVVIPPERHVPALVEAGVPRQLAEAVAEMLAAFAAGRLAPAGDRVERGTTTIDEVIAGCLQAADAPAV